MKIKEIISRRTDLSTFVVHLTRNGENESAKDRLISILTHDPVPTIQARTAFGMAKQVVEKIGMDSPEAVSQRCVCFTETPLEHLHLLIQKIDGRKISFGPYGLATTKKAARGRGVNPVWYIDQTKGHDWLTTPVNDLIKASSGAFATSPTARLTPFFEGMGKWSVSTKEFWWEREWRHVGDFRLTELPLAPLIGLCPEGDMSVFEALTNGWPRPPKWLDPRWGLEQIIARLAGFNSNEIEVF